MDDDVDKKPQAAADFTKRYPDRTAALCSEAKQAVKKLETPFR